MKPQVLIVDDEVAIVEGLMYLLETEKILSSGAFDRATAEALITGSFFSVIVADLRLHTQAEGLALLDSIRRISPRSRVVTLTGFSTTEMDAEVMLRGSVLVLRKPAGGLEILAAINELLATVEQLAIVETAAVEDLHTSLHRMLHSIPRKRYGMTADEAEDVVQQAWLLFLEKKNQIRMPRPWLIGTVLNLCKRQIGLTMHRREQFLGDEFLAALPVLAVADGDTEIALGQALAMLDQQSRDLCILIAIDGYAYEEVSALMGLPLGSIGPMYIRAKSKMRERLAA